MIPLVAVCEQEEEKHFFFIPGLCRTLDVKL